MILRLITVCLSVSFLLTAAGCQLGNDSACTSAERPILGFKKPPRTRLGSRPSMTMVTHYLSPDDLGSHKYNFSLAEKNGMVYTCKAGHIDTVHLRIAGDWTAFFTAKIFKHIINGNTDFSFKFNTEPTRYHILLTYPDNWYSLTDIEKGRIARTVSIKLGQYFAYTAAIWHEVLTWFGYKCAWFFPEFQSAFSWEDSYSDALGIQIAAEALEDTEHTYNEAMTLAIDRKFKELNIQPGKVAIQAAKGMKGSWYEGILIFIDSSKRNFDIGTDDGLVTPTIAPASACEDIDPQLAQAPGTDFLAEYGFKIKVKIEPREWEKNKILQIVYPDANQRKKYIDPAVHLSVIMDYIHRDATKRYGPNSFDH